MLVGQPEVRRLLLAGGPRDGRCVGGDRSAGRAVPQHEERHDAGGEQRDGDDERETQALQRVRPAGDVLLVRSHSAEDSSVAAAA